MGRLTTLGRWLINPDFQAPALLVLFSLPLSLPALDCFFTFDLLMNLERSVEAPWRHGLAAILVFIPPSRPLGGLLTLAIYRLAGFEPEYFYFVGIGIYTLNLVLVYWLLRRLTGSPFLSLAATALAGYSPTIHHVLYNFGAVYDLLSLTFILTALLAYRRHLCNPSSKWFYWMSFAAYLAALGSKEIAVALPVVLAAYQLLFHEDRRMDGRVWKDLARGMAPFLAVAVPYAAVKALSPWSTGQGNPMYELGLDSRILENLAAYLTAVANFEVEFSEWGAVAGLVGAAALAFLLGNRVMLFGLVWSIAFLVPVLPLPRVWQLFLYVPLVGFSLVAAAFLYDVGRRLINHAFEKKPRFRYQWLWRLALFLIVAARIQGAMAPAIQRAYQYHYQHVTAPFRSLAGQLFQKYPKLPEGSVVVFRDLPVEQPHDLWIPQFLVQLKYGTRKIRVFNLPTQAEAFQRARLQRVSEKHFFLWKEGELIEESPTQPE